MQDAPVAVFISYEDGWWHFNAAWPDTVGATLTHRFIVDVDDFADGWDRIGSQVKGWLDNLVDTGGEP